jgi:hypothetical protein
MAVQRTAMMGWKMGKVKKGDGRLTAVSQVIGTTHLVLLKTISHQKETHLMRPIYAITILGALATLALSSALMAQRPGGFGGRGGFPGGMDREQMESMRAKAQAMRTPDVEWLWTVLSFDFALNDEQTAKARTLLKAAWDQKRGYIRDAEQRDADWKAMLEELERLQETVDKQVKEILTKDQYKHLEDLTKERRKQTESFRPGGPPE